MHFWPCSVDSQPFVVDSDSNKEKSKEKHASLQEERGPLLQKEVELRQVVVDLHEPHAHTAAVTTPSGETNVTKVWLHMLRFIYIACMTSLHTHISMTTTNGTAQTLSLSLHLHNANTQALSTMPQQHTAFHHMFTVVVRLHTRLIRRIYIK